MDENRRPDDPDALGEGVREALDRRGVSLGQVRDTLTRLHLFVRQ